MPPFDLSHEAALGARAFDEMDFFAAYLHYRRLFDRLPFELLPLHVEHSGRFLKTLGGVGKQNQVEFHFEQLLAKPLTSATAVMLAQFGGYLDPPPLNRIRHWLELVLRDETAPELQVRARMLLAYFSESTNLAHCHQLIDSCQRFREFEINALNLQLLNVWQAKLLRDRGKGDEALARLRAITANEEVHWFVYFSAQVVLVNLWTERQKWAKAREVARDLRDLFHGRSFRLVQFQMDALERLLADKPDLDKPCPSGSALRDAPLPERDKFRKSDPGAFLRNRRFVGRRLHVFNLC